MPSTSTSSAISAAKMPPVQEAKDATKQADINAKIDKANIEANKTAMKAQLDADKKKVDAKAEAEKAKVDAEKK